MSEVSFFGATVECFMDAREKRVRERMGSPEYDKDGESFHYIVSFYLLAMLDIVLKMLNLLLAPTCLS